MTLQAHGLYVRLGGREVLRGVDAAFGPGWIAIVGPNGAGKSTLLRALAGLLPAASGTVTLQGRDLRRWPAAERGRQVAWLAQHAEPGGDLTVRDIVMLGRLPHVGLFGVPGAADAAAVDRAMEETGCAAWAGRCLGELSGGERQRVLLARALAVGAGVLLLDEPTTHLDPPQQQAVAALLRREGAARTVLTVLHDLSLALAADHLLVLDGGRVQAHGPSGDPAVHAGLERAFGHAVAVREVEGGRVAVPRWR